LQLCYRHRMHNTHAMPPKRKAELVDKESSKKRKLTPSVEFRLPAIEVVGEILGYVDFEQATILSRVSLDWRSAYKIDVLRRFKRQVELRFLIKFF
jgi:hypothetical protein